MNQIRLAPCQPIIRATSPSACFPLSYHFYLMSEAAFFYGTLMAAEVRSRVICGLLATPAQKEAKLATLRLRPAILKGHRRHALKNLDYPGVVYTGREEDQVVGVLCEGLYSQDVKRLDAFEGDEYKRCSVEVTPTDGQTPVNCQVYIWIEGDEHLLPHDWELDGFVNGRQHVWLQDRCEFAMVDALDTSRVPS
ncbi:Butirosin biosynthesis, BtrG-like protein [Fennellomyces sp. T-0311]|nr:Butirosin biosynthesis, BtrG-like protein [Fennellomyces sp. T-0311]